MSLPLVETGQIKFSALGTFWFGEALLLRVSERCQWGAWEPGCVGKEAKFVLVPTPLLWPFMAYSDHGSRSEVPLSVSVSPGLSRVLSSPPPELCFSGLPWQRRVFSNENTEETGT